jgi:hypothetical protein
MSLQDGWGRYRRKGSGDGDWERMHEADARVKLSRDEIVNFETEEVDGDGHWIRPFRFCEINPTFTYNKDGVLSF